MSSKEIITHCAPTLVGLKTGNIFNEVYDNKQELIRDIYNFNKEFKNFGISMIPLGFKNGKALIYVYRINDLKNTFKDVMSKEILSQYGYDTNDIYSSLHRLSDHIDKQNGFPHEIGLFLGFPPEDVKGFIDNNAANYKFTGYWKVYGDEDKARNLFSKFRKCQKILLDRLNSGFNLTQLVIQK